MLVLLDHGWEKLAQRIDDDSVTTVFSDFGWGETISAVSLRSRRGAITRSEAETILTRAARYVAPWVRLECEPDDLAYATQLVSRFELKLSFPDAIHVAVASRLGCTLVTADRRQATAAVAIGVPIFNPLEEP